MYWIVVKRLKASKVPFLSSVVRDARDIRLPTDKELRDKRVRGATTNVRTASVFVAIATVGPLLLASSSLGVVGPLRLAAAVFAFLVGVVVLLHLLGRLSGVSHLESLRAGSPIAGAIAETKATNRALRDVVDLIGTCELVARGYRPEKRSLRVVSRLESIETLRCLPLRRAVLSTSTRAIREIRSATRAIRQLSPAPAVATFVAVGQKKRREVKGVSSTDETSPNAALTSAALRDRLRVVREAASVFWYELLVCLERGATGTIASTPTKATGESRRRCSIRTESAWIAELASRVSTRYVTPLRSLRVALEREEREEEDPAAASEVTTPSQSSPPRSAGAAALAHVSRELRSSLAIVSAQGVLCHQQLLERLRVVASGDRTKKEALASSLADVVAEARRAVEENVRHTESLWTSMQSLAASIDRHDREDVFARRRRKLSRRYVAVSSSREATPDGTWEKRESAAATKDPVEEASPERGVVDVFVGGSDEEEEENSADKSSATGTRFVLSSSVLGDLKSALVLKSENAGHSKRTRRVPVVVGDEKSDGDAGAWEGASAPGVALVRELAGVLEGRRRDARMGG